MLESVDATPEGRCAIITRVEDKNAPEWCAHEALQTANLARSKERSQIVECFEEQFRSNGDDRRQPKVLLVEGPSGAGKTRLVSSTLRQRVENKGGTFLVGTFDPLQQPEPYHGFRQAFAVYPEAQTLFVSSSTKNGETQNSKQQRFAFLMFLRALKEPIVVLLLRNLHHADACALANLERLVGDLEQCPNLFVVATSTTSNDRLSVPCLSEAQVVTIDHMSQPDVAEFLHQAWKLQNTKQREALAALVHVHTQGHVFHVCDLLLHLLETGHIVFETDNCLLDESGIASFISTCHEDILTHRLRAAAPDTKEVLKLAACFGLSVPMDILQVVTPTIGLCMKEAMHQWLMAREKGALVFSHEAVQQAAYNMIPSNEKEIFHLAIARRLWKEFESNGFDTHPHMYVVLRHFLLGKRLVEAKTERYSLAHLCLVASRQAASLSSFSTASVCLELGIEVLGESGWVDEYELTLACYNTAAEMHLCTTNFKSMERMIHVVIERARTDDDRIQAEVTRVYSLGMSNRQNEAIDLGVSLLAGLGETFPKKYTTTNLLIGAFRVSRQLKGKTDMDLLSLHSMTDSRKMCCMQILNLLFLHTVLVRPKFTPFVALKFMSITLRHGVCLMAPQAFTCYGMIMMNLRRYDDAYRFGRLGVKLLEFLGHDQSLPRVYAISYGFIFSLRNSLCDADEKLLVGYRVGLETGDYEFACVNANLYIYSLYMSRTSLDQTNDQCVKIQSTMKALGQETLIRMMKPVIQTIHHLTGMTEDPLSAKGDVIDFECAYQFCMSNNLKAMAEAISWHRMILYSLFNDFALALFHGERCLSELPLLPCAEDVGVCLCFASVVLLQNAKGGSWSDKRRALRIAKKTLNFLKKPSLRCPHTFLHLSLFVEAELGAFRSHREIALQKYYCAIRTCESFLLEGFCRERAARFLYQCGRNEESHLYFEESCQSYERWGAQAKLVRLRNEMRELFPLQKEQEAVAPTSDASLPIA